MNNLLHANTLKEQGLYVVPLYRGLKFSGDTSFIDREYTVMACRRKSRSEPRKI